MGECQREREPLQVVSPDLHCQEKINVFSATGTEGWDLFCFLNFLRFLRFFYFYFLLNWKEEMKNWTQKLHNLKANQENNNILSFQPFVVRRSEEPEHRSCNFRVPVSLLSVRLPVFVCQQEKKKKARHNSPKTIHISSRVVKRMFFYYVFFFYYFYF